MEFDEFQAKLKAAVQNGLKSLMVTFPVGSERMSAEKMKAVICKEASLNGDVKKHVFYSANSVVKLMK